MTPKMWGAVTFRFDVDKGFKTKHNPRMSAETWSKIDKIAKHRGIPGATVKTWKHRNGVPAGRRDELIDAAKEIRIRLTYEDLKSIQ